MNKSAVARNSVFGPQAQLKLATASSLLERETAAIILEPLEDRQAGPGLCYRLPDFGSPLAPLMGSLRSSFGQLDSDELGDSNSC